MLLACLVVHVACTSGDMALRRDDCDLRDGLRWIFATKAAAEPYRSFGRASKMSTVKRTLERNFYGGSDFIPFFNGYSLLLSFIFTVSSLT